MRYYADLAVHAQYNTPLPVAGHEARIVRLPYGVCGAIFPWNFPFWLMGWGIAPALAAGNTVVIKPAEDTPLSTLYLCQLVAEAGLPAGVVNVVVGYGEPAGAALARHPGLKRMTFTGSPEVGKLVGEACGRNLVPVKLELGGKGAAVVFDDVDIDDTAQKLCQAITFHSGQLCCDATRWIIQDKIYDRFLSTVTAKMEAVRVGHGFDDQAQMGPVISEKQRQRILTYLERGRAEGADALLPGGACTVPGCEGGFYVKPALLGGSLNNVAAREEIFGPVAYVTRFRDEAEGIELANHTAYGLANSVWSADLERCSRVAQAMVAGTSWVNTHNTFPIGVPFAGVNLSGMGGGTNSAQTFYDYLRDLAVVRPYS
jgi:aldehyde dehydrogenase (NAD+)